MTVTAEAGITLTSWTRSLPARIPGRSLPGKREIATPGGPHPNLGDRSAFEQRIRGSGPHRSLGLDVVLPTGEILPTGTGALTTARGHFARRFFPADLTGLFLGSEGAFGVIVRAALKIHGARS